MQVGEGLIDNLTVSTHYFRSTLAVSLLDRFLDLLNRFVAGQDSTDAKETRLHDRVDAPAHSDCLRERISIDRKETNLFRDYLFLQLTRQSIPNGRRFARRVQKKHRARSSVLEHVNLVDKLELMAGDESGPVDEVS